MDSYYQDQQGNGMGEGSRSDIVRNSIAWLRKNGYMVDPSEGSPQQETFPSPSRWSGYPQGNHYVACNSFSSMLPSDYRGQEKNSFEAMVIQKLDALQAQMNSMALGNEEIGLRTRGSTQTELILMEANLRTRFEECLESYEERSIKRLEEHYEKIAPMLIMLDSRLQSLEDKFETLHWSSQMLDYRVDKLEQRVEQRMGQLYVEICQAQGKIVDSESDDDCIECTHLFEELPGYVGESIEKDARADDLEMRCESTSPVSCAYHENERLLCEDIASSRGGCLANMVVHEYSMNMEDMREWDYTAWSPVEERDHSRGAELPLHPEESSWSPTIRTCSSCELACAPQVQACFGALAFSASRAKSHEEPSWEEENSMVDFEEQKRMCKRKRRVSTQVWIPRGTLEVMRVFHMTELNLGEKSCVPHKARKRKRRRKSSNPQDGVG